MPIPIRRIVLELPPVSHREVLRYARAGGQPEERLLQEVRRLSEETAPLLTGRVCYGETEVSLAPPRVECGDALSMESRDLCRNLRGCVRVVLFAATIGLELDRCIAREGRLSPLRGLLLQALGAERIEALCDAFCQRMEEEMALRGLHSRPRFSPGYGDLPLETQRPLLALLDASRKIGVALNQSLLMSPSKSVTALQGFGPTPFCPHPGEASASRGCDGCSRRETCLYRRTP
ncbi:MAG: hypothetical protein ACI4SG_01840 [Oligosphaeraceae bacterium]